MANTHNKGLKLPAEILSPEDVAKFMSSFGKSRTDTRNRALLAVYWRAQLRCNEALDLRPCDVDVNRGTIVVLNGKGGHRRTVGMDPEACAIVRQWAVIAPSSPWLFCSHRGTRLDSSYVRRMVKRQATRAGLTQRVHVHLWRHVGACELLTEGVDMRVISAQLGHRSLATTHRYLAHLHPTQVLDTMRSRRPSGLGPT